MPDQPNFTLPPRMPDAWLEQVSKSAKPKLWPLILSSSVVAALIGWASSYCTARMVINANLKLEQAKAELQIEQDRVRARSAAYTNLAISLDNLHKRYQALLILIPKASAGDLKGRFAEVGLAVRSVEEARGNPLLLKSSITSEVEACLSELNPVLAKAQTDPKSALAHQKIDSDLAELAYKAQQEGQQFTLISH